MFVQVSHRFNHKLLNTARVTMLHHDITYIAYIKLDNIVPQQALLLRL